MTDNFARTAEQRKRLEEVGKLADSFKATAHEADQENGFSFAHIEQLKKAGYTSLTVPRAYGGAGISLYEFVLYQERLAQGDPAIALGMGWHLGVIFDLALKKPWPEPELSRLFTAAVTSNALVNSAATEPTTGSPSRGGRMSTRAEAGAHSGYRLYGRKTFTSLAPVLDYVIVSANLPEDQGVGDFLIQLPTPGVRIETTWNMMGMRGTGSHDLVLDGAELPAESLVNRHSGQKRPSASPHLLHIPACYLGIALAARAEALSFAAGYQPSSLDRPILYAPHIGQLIGSIDLELAAARHFMYSVAARWDEPDHVPEQWIPELAAVKTFAVQTAMSVVDKALRITGVHGLAQSHPLQRLYRDVRFGLHNPPMDDMTNRLLYQRAVQEVEQTGAADSDHSDKDPSHS